MYYARIAALCLSIAALAVVPLWADVPHKMSYQGRVTGTNGVPVDTVADLTVVIFADEEGATPLWGETHFDVEVTSGLFDIILGSTIPIPDSVFNGQVRWLGVQIESGSVSDPLMPIVSSAYAMRSAFADSIGHAHWYLEDGVLRTNDQYGISRGGDDSQVLGFFKNTMVNLGHHSTAGEDGLVEAATIGGGGLHLASGGASTICGGLGDTVTGGGSTIAGGSWNILTGNNSWMGGGFYSRNGGNYSAILGGRFDTIDVGVSDSYLFGFNSRLTTSNTFMVDMTHIRFGDEYTGYQFPSTDGTSGQTLVTDGAGQLSWSANAAGGGWIDDGSVVRLKDIGDKVGIGTNTPEKELDINGQLKVGSMTNIGKAEFYGDRSTNPYLQIMQNGATYGEGGEIHIYGDEGLQTISLDGNYMQAPRIAFHSPTESVIFDFYYEGDNIVQFPDKAINNLEILNEAGVGNTTRTTGSVTLTGDGPIENILWRPMSFPSAGYAVVIATAQISVNHYAGTGEFVYFGVSDQDDAFPTGLSFRKLIPGDWPSMYYNDIVTVQGYFPVSSGINNFYFLGRQESGSSTTVYDVELTVMFFPSKYAFEIKDGEGEQEAASQPDGTGYTMDDAVADQVEQHTRALRLQFEHETNMLREENERLAKRLEALEAAMK